ncbi:MAG: TIGR03960 family B12-binding radical SAM protein [Candidatus Margulisiibacteriota bacterium]
MLENVQRPGRYVGNELNSVHKDWAKAALKFVLAYPDTYEIGMSNLGLQILYHILNDQADVLAERCFAPWPDREEQLKVQNEKLKSLESQRPLQEFDVLGFSLGHELTYTNIVTMLKLGGIPLRSKERGEKDPLVLGGGPCSFNPEPLVDFFDFFVIGEAEEVLLEITKVLLDSRPATRDSRLNNLAKIPGVYVPGISQKVTKRYIKSLDPIPYPLNPIVPFIEAIHDRAAIEIMRGCKWGCKFCQAGWTYLPVREKSAETLLRQADALLKNTGYDELTLISLSSSDYSAIDTLARTLAKKYESKKINISLPSLRTNSLTVKLTKEVARVRSGSLTLAPEAGTQRLRDAIGKNLTEEQIIEGVKAAFAEGIEAIKLYFMIGLPTETDDDLLGLCALADRIYQLGRTYSRRARITVNLSTFIPKSHTPFQWERQIGIAETLDKQRFIKQHLRTRGIEIRWHQAEASYLEGIFSRGDRQLSKVIERAWELGARFDAWQEGFKFPVWLQAFSDCGIDPDRYLAAKPQDQPLPWDYIETGVTKEALRRAADKSNI